MITFTLASGFRMLVFNSRKFGVICVSLPAELITDTLVLQVSLYRHLQVVYFVNSGSEANDLAMLMARLYTKRFDVISLQ